MIDRADWSGYLSVLNMKQQQQLKSFAELTRSKFPDDADEADIILEDLFWKVDKETTSKYWSLLQTDMQALYIRFHGKIPT